jgi:FKBP-type peptidyl-prolyl cis-trans isomerase FklB
MKKKLLYIILGIFIGFGIYLGIVTAFDYSPLRNTDNINTTLETEIDSVSYIFGSDVAAFYQSQGLDSVLVVDFFYKGFNDVFNEDSLDISKEQGKKILQEYFEKIAAEKQEKVNKAEMAFLTENATKEGVITTESGLQYEILSSGDGKSPNSTDQVTVHYHGTLMDGTVFDSSVDRGEPATFPVTGVIPGWTEALQLMSIGDKWKLTIPSNLAYGERGAGSIGPNAILIFEVELLEINKN